MMFGKIRLSPVAKYSIGFALSLALTLLAYAVVVNNMATGTAVVFLLAFLALLQATVQLIFFLHVSIRRGSRWQLAAFLSMLVVLVIIVGGSLWIMYHLDYNMMHMTTEEVQHRLDKEAGF